VKKFRKIQLFDIFNTLFMLIILVIMIYPLYFIIIASISAPYEVAKGRVYFLPKNFTLEAYKNVFKDKSIWIGYRNSIFYTSFGTLFSIFLTIPGAYVLSKKKLPIRNFLSWYFLIPMYFGGGLIPTYLLVKNLHLLNKPYTLIILGGLSIHNMIVTRIFFQTSIPEELYESAYIDGASHFRSFFQIALPLAVPIIAVMSLFYGVTNWNSYFTALIYLSDSKMYPLQLIIRRILIENIAEIEKIEESLTDPKELATLVRRAMMAESMKYSIIFIASAPLLIAYPFVQKYFVKGVMIGSLKG
jgi:putative aldouronate transport system permease protein